MALSAAIPTPRRGPVSSRPTFAVRVPQTRAPDTPAPENDALTDAALVIITEGLNEKAGGATDRSDPQGRLRLLETNAKVYADIVPKVVASRRRRC